jgi:cytochrome c oxidase subunit 2|tara:strand:- start:4773 stop:5825 length:1053 start_codon:yes stop_codon:yes gene_type:complete
MTGCVFINPENSQSTFDAKGPVADRQLDIFWWILAGGTIVFVLVEAALVYAIFRFRSKNEEEIPKQTHGNNALEITWTIIPVILLAIIMVPTIQGLFYASNAPSEAKEQYTLEAIGHQWWFEFRYPNPSNQGEEIVTANEVFIPINEPIKINLGSVDVIHSFWVPKLAGKVDMVPSVENYMWFQADEPGEYFGQCAEYCGTSHANMKFKVLAVTQPEFDIWLSNQAKQAVTSSDPLALEGAAMFKTAGCTGCHSTKTIVKKGSKGRVGPNLAHVASRRQLAAGMMDNTDGHGGVVNDGYLQNNLRAWLEDPSSIKQGNIMSAQAAVYTDPNRALTEAQVSALVSYLTTLK